RGADGAGREIERVDVDGGGAGGLRVLHVVAAAGIGEDAVEEGEGRALAGGVGEVEDGAALGRAAGNGVAGQGAAGDSEGAVAVEDGAAEALSGRAVAAARFAARSACAPLGRVGRKRRIGDDQAGARVVEDRAAETSATTAATAAGSNI